VQVILDFFESDEWLARSEIVEEIYPVVEAKKLITLLYGIVPLPGWPSGSGGGLQTRSTWVRFPPPAPICWKESLSAHALYEVGVIMTKKAVEETFAALFALTDLRQIFRDTKPTYQFNSEQRREAREIIEKVRQSLETIEKELIK
jgi:hypothetical protein